MKIMLTPELKALIDRKVASGLYQSASEVVRGALRALKDRDSMRELRLQLHQAIDLGIEDFKAGRSCPMDENTLKEIEAEGRKKLDVSMSSGS